MNIKAIKLKTTTITAYSVTPIHPAIIVRNSNDHHSGQIIRMLGIPSLKYYPQPEKTSIVGMNSASFS
jgi:hypothetical protein